MPSIQISPKCSSTIEACFCRICLFLTALRRFHPNGKPERCFDLDDHFRVPCLLEVISFSSIERHRISYTERNPGPERLRIHFSALRALARLIFSLALSLSCLQRSALSCPHTIHSSFASGFLNRAITRLKYIIQSYHMSLSTLYPASSSFSFSTPTTPSTAAFTPTISSSIPIPPNTALHPT